MFPQMNDQFEEFISPAKEFKSVWLLLCGVALIAIFYAELMIAILLVAAVLRNGSFDLTEGLFDIGITFGNPVFPADMILILTTFIGMFLAVILTAYLMRERSPMSLIGRGPVVRNFLFTAAALFALMSVGTVVAHTYTDPVPNLPVSEWLLWLPIALPLLLVQITAEELIFRGYLLQELAARYKSRWVWFVLPSVLFGLLHLELEKFGPNAWLVVISTSLFGLFATDITVRTGNLGGAIGFHFVNNLFAMFVLSLDGTMTGLSLYVTPFSVDQSDTVRSVLLLDIAAISSVYLIYLLVIRLKQSRQLHSIPLDPM